MLLLLTDRAKMAANIWLYSSSPLSCSMFRAPQRQTYLRNIVNIWKEYSTKTERKEKRRQLIADFRKESYFGHIREFQRSGGKRFLAPRELLKKEESALFPNLRGNSLAGRSFSLSQEFPNHVTLLLIATRGIAQPMCDKYREVFSSSFKAQEKTKCIEVNAINSWFYGLFRYFITGSLRQQVPKDRHDSFLCYYGSIQELIRRDFIGNLIVGHAFLIDRDGFVRWKACANPTEEELDSMIKCTKLLIP